MKQNRILATALTGLALTAAGFAAGNSHRAPEKLDLTGASGWLNSTGLTAADLKGKVVLVEFWTTDCINCIHTLPYVEAWHKKYAKSGLVVIGIHTPETRAEAQTSYVRKALKHYGIEYPVALDPSHKIWNRYGNEYWPELYFYNQSGVLQQKVIGEGNYDYSERLIQKLLHGAGYKNIPSGFVAP